MVSALTCMFFSERTWRTQREKHGKSTDPVEHIAAKQSFWNNNHSNEWASFCTVISWKHKSNTWETIACVCGGVFVAKTTLFTWQKHQHPHSCELNSHPALDPLCKPCVAIKVPLYGHLSCHTYSYACTWASRSHSVSCLNSSSIILYNTFLRLWQKDLYLMEYTAGWINVAESFTIM